MQRLLVVPAVLFALVLVAFPALGEDAGMRKEIDELRAEVRALRAELEAMRSGTTAAPPAASAQMPVATPAATESSPATSTQPSTTLWGYGEANYNRPSHDAASTQADLRRAVLGFGHEFSENTRVLGELEWEHAVVSQDDQGESEVEQLYVEHQFRPHLGARVGLVLIPLGLLNEHHEPANYYGVERNFVETAIIPSTWREGGLTLFGSTSNGFNWNAGLTTGFDLSKWDATSDEGHDSPLGSIHQELQLAKAQDLSMFGALAYQGIPGFTAGGGVFTGGIGQGQDFAGRNSRLIIGEGHVRWQPGSWDLSALYARGHISDTESLNLTLVGDPTPVPSAFWGAYAQGALRIWQRGDSSLAPFVRFEEFNTASSYAAVPPGLGIPAAATERVFTGGINYWFEHGVVLKGDYQRFHLDRSRDRFNLGVGYQF